MLKFIWNQYDADEPLIIDPADGGWIYYQLLFRVSGTTIPAGDLVLVDALEITTESITTEPITTEPTEPTTTTPITTEPPLVEITEVETPAGLPDGYTLQQLDEDSYIVLDENGVPLGQVDVPEGKTIYEIDIMGEMLPYGKSNPKTSDENNVANIAIFMTLSTCLVVLYRKRSVFYN